MDSPVISHKFRSHEPPFPIIDNPSEWTPALIEIDAETVDWENRRVKVILQNAELDVTMRLTDGSHMVVANWPRSGPGLYRLTTEINGITTKTDITIKPSKISEAAYERLINDLETKLPASIAIGLQNNGGFSGVASLEHRESTLEEQVLRLRRVVLGTPGNPGLAQVLPKISESPHSILLSDISWVGREYARRPATHRFTEAFVRPGNIDEEGLPIQIADQRVELSVDVYENRLLKFFLKRVEDRLASLVRILETKQKTDILAETEGLLRQLRSSRTAARFLDEVQNVPNVVDNITMVFLKHPLYKTVLDRYLEYKNSFRITLDQPALEAPLTNFPMLYQSWATLVVIDTLMTVATGQGFGVESFNIYKREFEDLFIKLFPDGRQAIVLKHHVTQTRISLTPEQTFSSGNTEFKSVSFNQRPDIVIRIDRPGMQTKIVILDPKYKLDGEDISDEESSDHPEITSDTTSARPKKIDIDKMHAYRDAIRDRDGNRVVSFAGILYPGQSQTFSEDVQAIRAVPGEDQELRERISELIMTQII